MIFFVLNTIYIIMFNLFINLQSRMNFESAKSDLCICNSLCNKELIAYDTQTSYPAIPYLIKL